MMTDESRKLFAEETKEWVERMGKAAKVFSQPIDTRIGTTPSEVIHRNNKMTVRLYRSPAGKVSPTPIVMVYALVNRPYMLDLQPDRSMIRLIVDSGFDVYLVDWGYPTPRDRFLTLEDYILGYCGEVVDLVRERTGKDKVNLVSICQGGTFSTIYTALFPEKVRNLVTIVAPIDFDTRDGLLHVWSRALSPRKMVDVLGNIPGDFMNIGFLLLNPVRLMFDKYVGLAEQIEDEHAVSNFLRMEKWIFDSPAQAGEAWIRFMEDFYRENKLVKGTLVMGGRKVDLRKITMPVLNIYAEKDHLVPPAASIPLCGLVGSKDTETFSLPTGHIGIFVGGKSQNVLCPHLVKWLEKRSEAKRAR